MSRLRSNFLQGTLAGSILSGATTITSTGFASLPVVASPDTLTITLDPTGVGGNPEVVSVTAHSSSSTTVTVTRGAEGTTARGHALGVTWVHAPTATDFIPTPGSTETGLHRNTPSSTYGEWFTFGNAPNSMGFAGTGTPAEAWAARVDYVKFGDFTGLTNAAITKTTQAAATIAAYYGPTTDDSAEGFSVYTAVKDTGTPFTQTKPVTAIEGHASVEGGNSVTGASSEVLAVGSRTTNGTGTVTTMSSFAASGAVNSGTITNWYAFRQKSIPAGTVTNAFGVYTINQIISELGLRNEKTGRVAKFQADPAGSGGSSPAYVYISMPSVTAGETDLAGLRIQQGPGGLKDLLSLWLDGDATARFNVSRLGFVTARGTAFTVSDASSNGLIRIGQNGLEIMSAGLIATTVGGAGGAAALPANPEEFVLIRNPAGAIRKIPAYLP